MEGLDILESYKFVKVGEWKLNPDIPHSIIPIIVDNYPNEKVIYAFVVNNIVKYIGITKSAGYTLKQRMNDYKTSDISRNDSIDNKISNRIYESLKENGVDIYAFKPESNGNGILTYKELIIDLAAGLESPLIEKFDLRETGWNKY